MEPINLNLSPSCADCLAWSSDGILAIAAGDYTTLLVPRTSIHELVFNRNPSDPPPEPFFPVKIRTNQFTYREWPVQDPLSYKNFSLGEEQSLCKVTALGWSPEGLGKHRRCVLGVLTSNCVLSLWEAGGRPSELSSWRRTGIVNDALREYFEGSLAGNEDCDQEELEELKRKKRRIRAFDWSPMLDGESSDRWQRHGRLRRHYFDPPWRIRDSLEPPEISKDTIDDRKWGIFYLTITNDDNDILIARVYKDVRVADHDATIHVDILSHLHMRPPPPRMPQFGSECWLGNVLDSPRHIRRISWGPWDAHHTLRSRDKNFCSVSLIAFLHGNALHFCRVSLTEERQFKWSNVGKNVLELKAEFVRFVHKTIDLSSMTFESTLLWCENDTSIYSAPKSDSTAEEDEDDVDTRILHYHLTVTSGSSITLVSFPSNIYRHSHEHGQKCNFCRVENSTLVEPRYLDITQQDLTGKQSGHGNFQKVLWEQATGIAFTNSPLKNDDQLLHMAMSSSCAEVIQITKYVDIEKGAARDLVFCPSDDADWIHLIRSEKDRFDREHDLGGLALAKVWGMASIGHWVATCITLHPGDMVEYLTTADENSCIIMASTIKEEDCVIPWAKETSSLALYPFALNYNGPVLSRLGEQTKRCNESVVQWIIGSIGPNSKVSHDRLSQQIVRAAWYSIQDFKDQNSDSPLEILENPYRIPKAAIRSSVEWLVPENDFLIVRGEILEVETPELLEQCIICDASIPWTNGSAQCEGGHLFRRCSLTNLAIQEPGMSKWCSVCGQEFFNESAVYLNLKAREVAVPVEDQTSTGMDVDEARDGAAEGLRGSVDESVLSPNGLFWKLFRFFDTCPYCHGKYYTEQ